MAWTQFSIRWLIVVIAYAALATVALFRPPSIWQPIFQAAVVGLLFVAILGIVYRKGCQRAFWIGFAILGGGYCLFQLSSPKFEMNPLTHRITEKVHQRVRRFVTIKEAVSMEWLRPSDGTSSAILQAVDIPNHRTFSRQAEWMWVLLFGIIGGFTAQYFHATRDHH